MSGRQLPLPLTIERDTTRCQWCGGSGRFPVLVDGDRRGQLRWSDIRCPNCSGTGTKDAGVSTPDQ